MLREATAPLSAEFAITLELSRDAAHDLLMDTVERAVERAEAAGAKAA